MVGLIATTLLAGARMPFYRTSNMKRKIPRDAADRIAVAGPERDVRNLVPFLRMEKCFFLTSPFIEPRIWVLSAAQNFLVFALAGPEQHCVVFCARAGL